MKKIWITWEGHRRTIQLAADMPDLRLHVLDLEAPRWIRYPALIFRTLGVFFREKPKLVIVQNPSIVLAFFSIMMGVLMGFRVVSDTHNDAIQGPRPFEKRYCWMLPIYAKAQRWADLTIVTNEELSKVVLAYGGRPFTLPDRLPRFENPTPIELKGKHNVVFICTFADDEPYAEVINAGHLIDPSTYLYVTGPYERAPASLISSAPANVIFTGFLPDKKYIDLLFSCDVVMDLTRLENCLVCGAYEAVSLGKPLILSDTNQLRRYFHKGAIYTRNHAGDIANAIEYAKFHLDSLKEDVLDLREKIDRNFAKTMNCFLLTLEELLDRKSRA